MSSEPEAQKYHRGNVRADLITTALNRLRADGLPGLTLTGLAQAIGVSPPAVYNHFRNKEALFAAVAVEGFRQLLARQQSALDATESADRLHAAAIAYVKFAVSEPDLYRLMFRNEIENRKLYPELIDAEDAAFKLIGLLHYPKIDRRKRAQDYPRAFITWASLHGVAALISDKQVSFRNERELESIAMAAVDPLLLS